MARPKKGEEKNRYCRMAFRASEAVRNHVVKVAKRQKTSISDVLNDLIERDMAEPRK